MTWHRYICKPYTTPLNASLHSEIHQMLMNCAAGRRPVYHVRPFVLCYPTHSTTMHDAALAGVAYQMNTLATHIPQYPHLQTLWAKHGHTMHPAPTDPHMLTRIWIRQRGHGLNWLVASQIIDQTDVGLLHAATWSPFRGEGLNLPRLR